MTSFIFTIGDTWNLMCDTQNDTQFSRIVSALILASDWTPQAIPFDLAIGRIGPIEGETKGDGERMRGVANLEGSKQLTFVALLQGRSFILIFWIIFYCPSNCLSPCLGIIMNSRLHPTDFYFYSENSGIFQVKDTYSTLPNKLCYE